MLRFSVACTFLSVLDLSFKERLYTTHVFLCRFICVALLYPHLHRGGSAGGGGVEGGEGGVHEEAEVGGEEGGAGTYII